jgi:alkyl sulfatase BDS1-like metallo-beta-lactamase superfamily hydrolase
MRLLCLFLLWSTGTLCLADRACGQLRGEHPELIQVTDRVYCAAGYALGNILFVVTDSSVVVIDTSESPAAAQQALSALRSITELPVRKIIYTHFHGDHINGAISFRQSRDQELEVIAQQQHDAELLKYQRLRKYNMRLNAIQFGHSLNQRDVTLELAIDPLRPPIGYLRPTTTVDRELKFEEGGVRFELYHASGETSDHLIVWLPDLRVLFPGDLYYASFPMLASPMKHDRSVLDWADSLARLRDLSAEHLVPSHTEPLQGAQQIAEVLKNYEAAIRYVHDETVRCINQGMSLPETRRAVSLPENLAALPYLAQTYGQVAWSVNGVYRQYTGWYDLEPANLNPGPRGDLHAAIVAAAGGTDPIYDRALMAFENQQPQLALELVKIALDVEPSSQKSHELAAKALRKLAAGSTNTVQKNIYLQSAQEHDRVGR